MSGSLMTEPQRRHLEVFLQLLTEDLAQLARQPEVSDTAAHHCVRERLADAALAVRRIADAFGLRWESSGDFGRRVRAVANVWAARAPDLTASKLRGYGPLHPELAGRLDPLVEEMTRSLFALAECSSVEQEGADPC